MNLENLIRRFQLQVELYRANKTGLSPLKEAIELVENERNNFLNKVCDLIKPDFDSEFYHEEYKRLNK